MKFRKISLALCPNVSLYLYSWGLFDFLTFLVAPSVSLQQQLIGAPLGSTVSLDCQIESSPTALHFWSRSDGTVLHEASKYLMQSTSGGVGGVVAVSTGPSTYSTSWPSFRTQVRIQRELESTHPGP